MHGMGSRSSSLLLAASLSSSGSVSSCSASSSCASSCTPSPRARPSASVAPWWQAYADTWRSAQTLARVASTDASLLSFGVPGLRVMPDVSSASLPWEDTHSISRSFEAAQSPSRPIVATRSVFGHMEATPSTSWRHFEASHSTGLAEATQSNTTQTMLAARARSALNASAQTQPCVGRTAPVLSHSRPHSANSSRMRSPQSDQNRLRKSGLENGSIRCKWVGGHDDVPFVGQRARPYTDCRTAGAHETEAPELNFAAGSAAGRKPRPKRPLSPAVRRSFSDVKQILRRVCAGMGYARTDADYWAGELEAECLVDLQQLKDLNDEGWVRIGLPLGLELEIRRVLAASLQQNRPQQRQQQSRRRPDSAPAGHRCQRAFVPPQSRSYLAQFHQRGHFVNPHPWKR